MRGTGFIRTGTRWRSSSLHREAEVLRWVAAGKSDAQIGAILGTSPRTVQKHLQRLYEKLGVENRTAAAMRAPRQECLALVRAWIAVHSRSLRELGVASCGVLVRRL